MSPKAAPLPLPIDPLIPEIVAGLESQPNAILIAPPGAGKTTRVPPALLGSAVLKGVAGPEMVMLQPRRVAARAAAARIADEQGWRLGGEVGYQVRFDNRTSAATRLRVVTEGILTRRLLSDPYLEKIGCVVLDEFHERSIHADLALALLRELQQTVRPELRILVMSATLDPKPIAEYLATGGRPAAIFQSAGRLHDVELEHAGGGARPIHEQAAGAIRRELGRDLGESGHVLVFLPGMGEIRRTAAELGTLPAETELHVLHSATPAADQDRALAPSARRKLILATNIAETSLTIDGVRTVIDGGLARVLASDPRLGIDRLELRRISRAAANQRAGRAGRTAPGRCIRLWSRAEEAAMAEFELPEIQRIDLTATVLALHAFGAGELAAFRWFERPRPDAVTQAERLLSLLGALDAEGRITRLGRRIAELPIHPRLARLLLAGAERGLGAEAATLAAMLSEQEMLSAPTGRRRAAAHEGDSDLLERLELVLDPARAAEAPPAALATVQRLRGELLAMLPPTREGGGRRARDEARRELARLPLVAYPDRVTVRRDADATRGVMVGGRGIVLEPASVVRRARLFLSLDPRDPDAANARGANEARVSLASAIEEAWLEELHPGLLARRVAHAFDEGRGRVISTRQIFFAGLMIREDITGAGGDRAGAERAFGEYVAAHAGEIIAADEGARPTLARIEFTRRHMPELGLPAREELAAGLAKGGAGCTSLDELRSRDLKGLLLGQLAWPQRAALEEHAPEAIAVPSGSRVRLRYDDDARIAPVLAARLQELFGLGETPRIAGGRVAIVLHLLGPNYRPVQITSDLRSFWRSTYAEVRRDLKARYPKHPWPEDPWNAPPVAVGRRR